tara:strand:- start:1928 stop:3994 length:2067 start_codon:yes stop_codon:yes gene_type:complete
MSAPTVKVPNEEESWIKNASRLPRARMLMDHLAAFDATITCGGVKGIEPPIDQTATWRRIFCYDYFNGSAPLGITCKPDGKLPKCIGIMNLSGKHCIYHSESYTLAKVVCLSSQEVQQHIISSLNAVLAKADELGASVLFCFCLPFQAGLERVHWDIRTIRKTTKGAVKDGELCFSSGDGEPRTVPCTKTLEYWPDTVMRELVRKLKSDATPICLDRVEGDELDVRMTPEAMETMIEMLKSDRRKMMDSHKQEIEDIKQRHSVELANAQGRAEEAEQDAAMRIAKVAHASKTAEDTMKKKVEHLETNGNTLREQLLTQQNIALEAKASLAGQKLEREQEIKQSMARQKTLEAQVNKFRNEMAKQTTEQAKARKDKDRLHEDQVAVLNSKIAELQSNIKILNSASLAVQASSKEARSDLVKLQATTKSVENKLGASKKGARVMRGMLALAGMRLGNALDEARSNKSMLAAQEIAANDAKRMLKEVQDTTSTAPPPPPPPPPPPSSKDLAEAKREIERKEHLLKEMEKRTCSLEKRLTESDAEVKKLSSTVTTPPAKEETGKLGSKKGGSNVQTTQEDASKSYAHNTVNVSQNTAVFMAQPPHQQAFPAGQYTMDPALENTISQLHSALNCITAMARSSSVNSKHAEMTQAKLDALCQVGIVPQQGYYDPAMHPMPMHGHPNGNGYGYTR